MGSRSLLEAKAVLIFGEIFLVLLGWLMYCWAMVAIRMSNIATTHQSIPFIKDGGLLIVEDVHPSYFKDFGNPSKYSFINYAKLFIDDINARFPSVEVIKNIFGVAVYSEDFYDSIVANALLVVGPLMRVRHLRRKTIVIITTLQENPIKPSWWPLKR